jgi:hypothetical protein
MNVYVTPLEDRGRKRSRRRDQRYVRLPPSVEKSTTSQSGDHERNASKGAWNATDAD